jgi:hypothetical protein
MDAPIPRSGFAEHTRSVLAAGAHLITPRRGYLHHGIYVGNDQVVHYAGLAHRLRGGPIEVISVDAFTQGYSLWVLEDRVARFTPDEVVERAMSRLGEDRYHVFKNNCEHFCEWCLRAEHRSYQVDRLLAAPRRVLEAANSLGTYVLGAVGGRRQSRETMFV